jgi:hypothetical protein
VEYLTTFVRRNWPDLRRDYDKTALLDFSNPSEGTDLIYEGITTMGCQMFSNFFLLCEGTDLIYEGITTIGSSCNTTSSKAVEGTDLIYEGITTLSLFSHCFHIQLYNHRRNWPDLRRDYDLLSLAGRLWYQVQKELTWFTKGLRP